MKKVLIISGSPRTDASVTNVLADIFDKIAEESGLDSSVWKLGERPLPASQHAWHQDPFAADCPEVVRSFATVIRDSEIIILITPTYHGSYSGLLKNAIDCMQADVFRNKMVVLSSIGWGATAAIPLSHLADVVRTTKGWVEPSLVIAEISDIDVSKRDINNGSVKTRIAEIVARLGKER